MSDVHKFDAVFNRVAGTLTLTSTTLAWVPTAGAMDRQQQALNRVIREFPCTTAAGADDKGMMASKAGAPNTSLKLLFKDDVPKNGLTFKFTSASKDADRQKVQDLLIPFVSANKTAEAGASGASTAAGAAAGGSGGAAGTPTAGPSGAVTPGAGTPGTASPAVSTPVGTPGTPSSLVRKRKHEDDATRKRTNILRQRVLRRDATLKELHRALVLGRQISEDDFWSGREALLRAEEIAHAQRPGRSSRLLDDRFALNEQQPAFKGGTGVGVKKAESGPLKLNITKELTREIFEEFPVVQDAYAKHVPPLSEAEFWKRYFESTLWERHRASTRKTALDGSAGKKDDIFDAYLEDPDWELAPRKEMAGGIETFLDLAATEEDHGESTLRRDVTMQAGKQRESLPLIRRFNDHSEKLLKAGGASAPEDILAQIELEELNAAAPAAPIALDVRGPDVAASSSTVFLAGRGAEDKRALVAAEADKVAAWRPDFGAVCLPNPANPAQEQDAGAEPSAAAAFAFQRDAQAVATRTVRDLYGAANAASQPLSRLPAAIVEEMRLLHNATTEFLRQYYGAIHPPPPGALGGQSSAAQRQHKAAKMLKYLAGTEAKINAIVTIGEIERVDPERIRAVLAPTLGAVRVALDRDAKRNPPAPAVAAK